MCVKIIQIKIIYDLNEAVRGNGEWESEKSDRKIIHGIWTVVVRELYELALDLFNTLKMGDALE